MPDAIEQFANAKYLNLETFRKTGVGVRTPVSVRAGSRAQGRFLPLLGTRRRQGQAHPQ